MDESTSPPSIGEPLDCNLVVRRMAVPACVVDGEVHESAFRESGRAAASVWETTRTTRAQALAIGGGNGRRTASILIDVKDVVALEVPYRDSDSNPLVYSPQVVWSDPGPTIPLDALGREGHADIYPMVPQGNSVSNKQRKMAERILRTELARCGRLEAIGE